MSLAFSCSTIVRVAAAIFGGLAVTGCAEAYLPDFDGGLLNPDIRLVRVGELMEGVKCATVAFMAERQVRLAKDREANPEYYRKIETALHPGTKYSPYHLNWDPSKWTFVCPRQKEDPKPKIDPNCRDNYGLTSLPTADSCNLPGQHFGFQLNDKDGSIPSATQIQKLTPKCVPNLCDVAMGAQKLGATIWDYSPKSNLQPFYVQKGCTAVPDYSRFALDETNSATIDLMLNAANSGYVNYTKIDATKLPFYPFITAGNSQIAAPFPMAQIMPKGTTTFEISTIMPQSIHAFNQTAAGADYVHASLGVALDNTVSDLRQMSGRALQAEDQGHIENIANELRNLRTYLTNLNNQKPYKLDDINEALVLIKTARRETMKEALLISNATEAQRSIEDITTAISQETDLLVNLADKVIKATGGLATDTKPPKTKPKQVQEFSERCNVRAWTYRVDSNTQIDFMGLKRVLENAVERQDVVYRGIPDVTLSQLILTSAFELVLDASAGTQGFLRFFPVLVPPTVNLHKDHTHTLKITFNGKKQKGDTAVAAKLSASCKQRVKEQTASVAFIESSANGAFCDTQQGQLLEGILEAVEKSSTSTPGSSGQ